jgi:ubiquitin-conjugating enzyme E2 H
VSRIFFFLYLVTRQFLLPILEYVQRFATKEAADAATEDKTEDEDEEMSDIGSISEEDS